MTAVNAVIIGGVRLAAALVVAATAWAWRPDLALAGEDAQVLTFIEADQLEYRLGSGEGAFSWDAQAWIGEDYHKIWFKTQGDSVINGAVERAELQILYSRTVTAFWDLQIGARYDRHPDPARGYAVLGIQGLAPYFLEVDAAAFVSDEGDASARLEAEYELLFTQRLIVKPFAELNVAVQDVEDLGLGSGVTDIELGVRLRYEIAREVAPYVGLSWDSKIGPTADSARRVGKDVDHVAFVAGLRIWF